MYLLSSSWQTARGRRSRCRSRSSPRGGRRHSSSSGRREEATVDEATVKEAAVDETAVDATIVDGATVEAIVADAPEAAAPAVDPEILEDIFSKHDAWLVQQVFMWRGEAAAQDLELRQQACTSRDEKEDLNALAKIDCEDAEVEEILNKVERRKDRAVRMSLKSASIPSRLTQRGASFWPRLQLRASRRAALASCNGIGMER